MRKHENQRISENMKPIAMTKNARSSADADKPARRVSRSVKFTRHGTIRYIKYGFLLLCYSNFVRKTNLFDMRYSTCAADYLKQALSP